MAFPYLIVKPYNSKLICNHQLANICLKQRKTDKNMASGQWDQPEVLAEQKGHFRPPPLKWLLDAESTRVKPWLTKSAQIKSILYFTHTQPRLSSRVKTCKLPCANISLALECFLLARRFSFLCSQDWRHTARHLCRLRQRKQVLVLERSMYHHITWQI